MRNRIKSINYFQKNKKINWVYLLIFTLWILIFFFNIWFFILFQLNNISVLKHKIFIKILLVINCIFMTVLYCNGIRDFIFVIYYYSYLRFKKNFIPKYFDKKSKVLLIYVTCDDFDSNSLEKSMYQNYSNFEVYILDDSKNEFYKKKIDDFSTKHNISVIRRNNNKGFKAGNINNFLQNYDIEYDYFVILDSDEIIPSDFITNILPYFNNKNVGIVQANHKGTRWNNKFDKIGCNGVISSWTTFISVKNNIGIVTLNGHGAMISKKCYLDVGGFPEIVAEDLGFTVKALEKKYKIIFAKNVICEEKFPIDFLSFKKRNIKWTQGNFEFFKKIGWKILFMKIPFFKKIDLWISTTTISTTILSLLLTIINFSILYPIGFRYNSLEIIWVLLIIFTITPLINDFIYHFKRMPLLKLIKYLLFCSILYPSMLVSSLITLIKSIFGKKALFVITPKNSYKYSFIDAIKYNLWELIIATILLILFIIFSLFIVDYLFISIVWIITLVIPMYSTIFLTLFSNKKERNKNEKSN